MIEERRPTLFIFFLRSRHHLTLCMLFRWSWLADSRLRQGMGTHSLRLRVFAARYGIYSAYSYLRAVTGLTRAARKAGMYPATNAITVNPHAAATIVIGSFGDTPYS